MNVYAELSSDTWEALADFCDILRVERKENLLSIGETPSAFYFVCEGLLRAYTLGEEGREYNKIFFAEHSFPGSMTALLKGEESEFALQALEDSVLIRIDYKRYRTLLKQKDDLKWYHIQYIEKNWILEKEPQEVSLVLNDAGERYKNFIRRHPDIARRLPQHHIASRLGITPTQLSRIKKSLK